MEASNFDPDAERVFVDQVRAGSREHLRELDRRLTCVPRILARRNRALGGVLSDDELHDVVQDTMVVILNRLPSYRPLAPLESWIFGICCRQLSNAVRHRERRRRRSQALPEELPDARQREVSDAVADYAEALAMLEALGGIEAEVLQLKHLEGLTFEEIGRRLGLPTGTAKTHYRRGLIRLRRTMAGRTDRRIDAR